MTTTSHLTRCASIAIAATLALGSTSLLAQEAAAPPAAAAPPPVIVIPEVAPPPAAAPTIVIPEELTQPQPQAAAPEAPARTTPRTTAPAPTRAAAPRPAPAAAVPEPVAPDTAATDIVPLQSPIAQAPLPEPVAAPEPTADLTATDEPAGDGGNIFSIVLVLVAALGLILLGLFALRRKGPRRYAAAAPTIEKPVVRREPAQPLAELPKGTVAPVLPAATEPEPALAQPAVNYSGAAFGATAKPATSLSHSGASVALPRELPATYEEREALIQRMVAAPPDRANPFRSYRARLRRARLILASLGRDFKDADPWIDLSQYPSNWPELARRQSAAA